MFSIDRLAGLCFVMSTVLLADEDQSAPVPAPLTKPIAGARLVERPQASEDELVTDRPDFTESANTIRPNWYQLETGFGGTWENRQTGKVRNLTLPFPLFRLGLTERLELRVSTDGYGRTRSRSGKEQIFSHGFGDFEVGFKYLVWKEKEWLPQFAVIASVSEPYGNQALSSGSVDSTVKLCWAKELPGGWESSGNVNIISLREDGRRFVEKDVTLSLGHALPGNFKGYVETYRLMSITVDRENLNVFQTGWARQIKGQWQFDMSVARTYAGSAPQWSLMGGVTFKAPFVGARSGLRN